MTFNRGTVVKALAGREGGFFAVLGAEGDRVFIANGKQYKINKPKRKNQKHISLTKIYFEEEILNSDKKLKKAILALANSHNPTGG